MPTRFSTVLPVYKKSLPNDRVRHAVIFRVHSHSISRIHQHSHRQPEDSKDNKISISTIESKMMAKNRKNVVHNDESKMMTKIVVHNAERTNERTFDHETSKTEHWFVVRL